MAPEASAVLVQEAAPAKSGRFAINLVSNVGKLALTMLVGAWYVPFLIRQLGPAAYGMIPLASMITSYMGLITFALDSAMARSMTISLERGESHKANVVFNVAFWGNLAIAALLAIPAAATIFGINHIVRIPGGYESATQWLYIGTVAAFLLNQVKSPFGVSCFALNRLDLQNLVIVAETLTRVGLVAVLFLAVAPRIEYVGAAILAGTIVSTIGAVWFWKSLTPGLHISLRYFDWPTLKSLSHTSGWMIVSQVGVMLYLNIDLLMANRLFGPVDSGRYAAILQVSALLSTLGMAIGEIFAPTMYQKYARGNLDDLAAYLNRAIKFLGLVMALIVGLLCGFARPLLSLWIGPQFEGLALLLVVMAVHQSLNLGMYPLYAVPLAANRVKVPGIVTLAVGVINLVLALVLARAFGWGLYGLAIAGAISLTLRRLVFTPLYVAAVLHQPRLTYYRCVIPIICATLATVGLCQFMMWQWPVSTWFDLALAATAVSGVFLLMTWFLLSCEERAALKEMAIRWRD